MFFVFVFFFALVDDSAANGCFFLSLLILASFVLLFSLQVRVFTFSVGQHNYDVNPLRWIACANKG